MLWVEKMKPDPPEKKSIDDPALPRAEGAPESGDGEAKKTSGQSERTPEEWFAGVGAGMKGVSRKLLDQVPSDLREKVAEQARTNGPGSAAVMVEGAALKARGFKSKFALKTLAKILRALDLKIPRK